MIYRDNAATIAAIRRGEFVDQDRLYALCDSYERLAAEAERLQALRSKAGSTTSERKAAAARRNGRKYKGRQVNVEQGE